MNTVELSSDERPGLTWQFEVLSSVWQRLKGLLGTNRDATPVLLLRCSSVHTFAMHYDLDLAFVGQDGQVMYACTGVPPGRLVSRSGAFCVLERPSSQQPWLEKGERVRILSLAADDPAAVIPRERKGYEH